MRILPVFTNRLIMERKNNHTDYSQYRVPVLRPPLACDTVCFGRSAPNAEGLRDLMRYGIPDMYSGKEVIPPEILERFYSKHIFSKSIRNIIKIIKPYEKSLHTVESQFFSYVKNKAKTNPYYKLSDVVRELAPEHNSRLILIQKPIFDELTDMSMAMPDEQKEQFFALMNTICKKLLREPVQLPFSAKEFRYKLQRITDEISQTKNPVEIAILKKMTQLAKKLPEKTEDEAINAKTIKSKVKRHKKIKNKRTLIKERADILTQIEILRTGTSLQKNDELTKLFSQTRSKIYNIPIVIPFNRKSFIYELQKITDTLEDQKLAHKMVQKAIQLPTSHDDISAFIMKCVEYSSDKIGYNMMSGSAGCIDHLIPFVKGGKDCIENYGISSAYYNSERAERSIAQQLKKYPQTYINCQKQVNKLIELCNRGVFKKVKLPKHYIYSFARRMYKLSPEDNRLVLNLDKLK